MKKAGYICFALQVLGLGIALILRIGLGCDAITMMNDGIAKFLQVNYTISGFLYSTILLLLALIFARKSLGLGSVAYSYLCGISIDFYSLLLRDVSIIDYPIWIRIGCLLIAQLFISLGFAMLIQLDLGRSPLDALLAKLEEVTPFSYRAIKTICDILYVLIACMLGSTFGVGTIFCVCSGGFLIQKLCNAIANYHEYTLQIKKW